MEGGSRRNGVSIFILKRIPRSLLRGALFDQASFIGLATKIVSTSRFLS